MFFFKKYHEAHQIDHVLNAKMYVVGATFVLQWSKVVKVGRAKFVIAILSTEGGGDRPRRERKDAGR